MGSKPPESKAKRKSHKTAKKLPGNIAKRFREKRREQQEEEASWTARSAAAAAAATADTSNASENESSAVGDEPLGSGIAAGAEFAVSVKEDVPSVKAQAMAMRSNHKKNTSNSNRYALYYIISSIVLNNSFIPFTLTIISLYFKLCR